MKARPRFIVIVGFLAGLAGTAALAYAYRSSIAVSLAPKKSADASQSELAKSANAKFWDAVHGGRYDDIPVVLEALTAAYPKNPRDTETAAHIAFTHVWALNEGARSETRSATATDGIVLSRKYFAEPSRLAPEDQRYKGFPHEFHVLHIPPHRIQKAASGFATASSACRFKWTVKTRAG